MAEEVPETSQELSLVCESDFVFSDPGDDVVLSCHLKPAISAASMEIKWRNRADLVCHYKDGQMIESCEGRVNLSLEDLHNGNVSLILRDVRRSQKGLYICEVINERRSVQEYIFLFISSEDFSLVVPTDTVSAALGSDVILPVHLSPETSAVSMKIKWYKESELIYQCMNRLEITNNYENRVSLSIQELERGNVSLTLRNVQHSDSGDYTCKVFHGGCLKTGIVHLQVRELRKRDSTLELEYLNDALRRTYAKTKLLEEHIKIIKQTSDEHGKRKKKTSIALIDESTVDRHLREVEEMQRFFLPYSVLIPWYTNSMEGIRPLSLPTRRTNSMEGIPPLLEDNSRLGQQLTPSLPSHYSGLPTRRTNSMEGIPPLLEDNSRLGQQLTPSLPSHYSGLTTRRANSMEGIPPLLERESSSQNTRQSREGNISTERELFFPPVLSQVLLRTRTESVISRARRSMTYAQEIPGATIQMAQERRLTNIVTEPARSSPDIQSQVQERERTSQSVTSQPRVGTRRPGRPENRTQRRQENTESNCQIL